MNQFKVICKEGGFGTWIVYPTKTKIVTTFKFFGLIKKIQIVPDEKFKRGPSGGEICTVIDLFNGKGILGYVLYGYPFGAYNSKYFNKIYEAENMVQTAKQEPELIT